MRYISENHDVVVNAQGGFNALERLGFVSEINMERLDKKEANKNRIAEWVKTHCCETCKRTAAFCICEGDDMSKKKVVTKKATAPNVETNGGSSRNDLMLEVKSHSIKQFRVMNKAELAEIVNGATPQRIEEIQKMAVDRWKAGQTKK